MILIKSRYWFLVVTLIWLSACSILSKDKDADDDILPNPLVEIETLAKITKVWSKNIGKGYAESYSNLSPAYAEGSLYIADYSGLLACLDANNGGIIWKIYTDIVITGGPGVGSTLVLVGSGEGDVLAYDRETGEAMWHSKVSSEILAAPQEANSIVVVRTIDGKVVGLNASDGNRIWIYDRTVPALTLRGNSYPVITGDIVIVGSDGGYISALELQSGKLLWETNVALSTGRSQLERMIDIDSEPIIIGNNIYVATFQGRIASIDLESGQINWAREISTYTGLTSDGDNIYITDDRSYVWALDRLTGDLLWKQEDLYARMVTRPVVIGNLVIVGDFEGYLHWLAKDSGLFQARTRLSKDTIKVSPVALDDIIYAYSRNGTLSAYTYY